MDVQNILTVESLRHLAVKPNQSIIGFNMELWKIESLIAQSSCPRFMSRAVVRQVGGRLYERFRARATWAENKDVLKDHSLIVAKPYSER
jgi:hypothetical protein